MKALSVKQPYAFKITNWIKNIETRTWSTKYRGNLLICSTKIPSFYRGQPGGHAVCIVELIDCRPMTKADEFDACCTLYPGAYSWILDNIRPLEKPFPVKGRLGLFEVEFPE